MNHRGGALLATVIISMLLLSVTFWYISWSWTQSQETAHARATQRALENAESGLQAAQEQLMMPYADRGFDLASGSGDIERGRYEFEISEDTQTPNQVQVYSTGYCYFPTGSEEDPISHQRAQRAIVRADYFVDRLDKLMVTVPGKLNVNPGAVAAGVVYASDLVFVNGSGDNPAKIGGAAYSHSIARDDGTMDAEPSYVIFASTPVRLGFPLRLPQLSGKVRGFYKSRATSQASQLNDGASLDGSVEVPDNPDFPVYFCDGDLHLSRNGIFVPQGLFIVYVTGVLHIHNSVMAEDGWTVFLAEKGIQIEPDAPANLILHGTYVTNGAIVALPQHQAGDLIVNGSLVAGQGIDLAAGWDGTRTYYHRQAFPALPLPHVIERLQSEVVQGKYR